MRNLTILLVVVLACSALAVFAAEDSKSKEAAADAGKEVAPVLNFTMDSLDGKPVNLAKYQGKVVLIVNTASKCGNTPQYEQLQKLHEKYGDKGLAVLGFPSNDFKQQEPGSSRRQRRAWAKPAGRAETDSLCGTGGGIDGSRLG